MGCYPWVQRLPLKTDPGNEQAYKYSRQLQGTTIQWHWPCLCRWGARPGRLSPWVKTQYKCHLHWICICLTLGRLFSWDTKSTFCMLYERKIGDRDKQGSVCFLPSKYSCTDWVANCTSKLKHTRGCLGFWTADWPFPSICESDDTF